MSRLVRGDLLAPAVQADVLARYCMRLTQENLHNLSGPAWQVSHAIARATSDEMWLATHAFYVKADGTLDNRRRYAEMSYLADETSDA